MHEEELYSHRQSMVDELVASLSGILEVTMTKLARDVMTPDPVTVRAGATVKAALRLLDENDISSMPVVDSARRIRGVVSEADLIHDLVGPDQRLHEIPLAAPPHPVGWASLTTICRGPTSRCPAVAASVGRPAPGGLPIPAGPRRSTVSVTERPLSRCWPQSR
jgi:CBS domain-containing protein